MVFFKSFILKLFIITFIGEIKKKKKKKKSRFSYLRLRQLTPARARDGCNLLHFSQRGFIVSSPLFQDEFGGFWLDECIEMMMMMMRFVAFVV